MSEKQKKNRQRGKESERREGEESEKKLFKRQDRQLVSFVSFFLSPSFSPRISLHSRTLH